jgi:hypothetical protein
MFFLYCNHQVHRHFLIILHKAEVALCSEIRTKHSKLSEHQVEFFLILNLVVGNETARL